MPSLLYTVVFASRCRSNHHYIAVEALQQMQGPDADKWCDALLAYNEDYLAGAKAPDTEFKDFKNHVLHVRDNDWGGAVEACEEWYRRTVSALREKDWKQAAWSAGVMSHYYADPLQPFHTHQTEEENVIHRAVEWSFFKSYATMMALLQSELGGYPHIDVPNGDDWLGQMVRAGAHASNVHYELIIEHYNFSAGVKNPPAGLDDAIRRAIAPLLGHAIVGLARILDRAFEEAAVSPPNVAGLLQAALLSAQMPIQAVKKSIDHANARKEVTAQHEEFRRTGKVRATLGEDDKAVRELHANEVLKTHLSSLDAKWPRQIGGQTGQAPGAPKALPPPKPKPVRVVDLDQGRATPIAAPTPTPVAAAAKPPKPAKEPKIPRELPTGAPRAKEEKTLPKFMLDQNAPVVKAPSIGPKTAQRLEALGVHTIGDLLALNAEDGEHRIDTRHISAQVIRDWQAQALLACTVPGLKSREAQALVACGVHTPADLAAANAEHLCEDIAHWGLSDEGQRAWGNAPAPNADDIQTWIERCKRAQSEGSVAA